VGHGAPRQAGAGAARDHRHFEPPAFAQHRTQFLLGVRQHDQHRLLTKHGQSVAFVGSQFFVAAEHAIRG
jgi:hypothetical protein